MDHRTPFQLHAAGVGPRAKPAYLYVASSWRNPLQPGIVRALHAAGLDCYDFRNPRAGEQGFNWREIDPNWQHWTPEEWRAALDHPIARRSFSLDKAALDHADCGVLLLPCGRSAHLEVGYLAGRGVPVFTVVQEPVEPELMQLLLGPPCHICTNFDELFRRLGC